MPDYSAGTASVDIKPNFDGFVRKLRADLDRVQAELDVSIGVDDASLDAAEEKIRRRLGGISVDIQVGADTRVAADEIAALRALAGQQMTIDVDADTSAAAAQIAGLRGTTVDVNVRADRGSLDSLRSSIGSASLLNLGALGIGNLPAAGFGLASMGADLQSLAQTGALLPGIFGGAAAGIGTLVVAGQGLKDSFSDSPKKAQAAYQGLTQEGRALVDVTKGFGDQWTRVQESVQSTTLNGLADPLKSLIGNQLPVLARSMTGISAQFNTGFGSLFAELGNSKSQAALEAGFANTATAVGVLNGALVPAISSVRTLGVTGSTFLPQLAQGVTNLTTRLDAFLTRSNDSGDLSRWMREGTDAAGDLVSVVGNLGSSLNSVFRAVKGDGEGFLVTVDRLSGRMAEWLKSTEGQQQLRSFFHEGREQLDQWVPILQSLGSILKSVYEATQAWSAILMPFLQAASSLLSGHDGLLKTALVSYLAFKTLSPIFTGLQAAITGANGALTRFNSAQATAGVSGANAFRSSLSGIGAMLGPGGLVTVGVAAAAVGIGLLAQRHQEAKQAAEEQRIALEALGQTLDKQTGKVTEQTIAQVSETLGKEGFLTRADTLGVDKKALAGAAAGIDPDAKAAINERLTQIILEQQGSAGGRWNQAKVGGLNDQDIAQALQGVPEAVTKYGDAIAAAQAKINAQGGDEVLPNLQVLKAALNDIGESAATLGGKMNDTNSSLAKLGEEARQIAEARDGIHELTESGRADFTAFGVTVEKVTSQNTVLLKSATDEQIAKLRELGFTADRLPDKTVTVTLNADQAKADIKEIAAPAVKTVEVRTVTLTGTGQITAGDESHPRPLPGRALGGEVSGGVAGRDSVPSLLMPGEHVFTTSDVDKLGGQAGVYRFRAALQSGMVGRFANGGAVGWSAEDETKLQSAITAVTQAEERRATLDFNKKASDADKRQADLKIEKAKQKVAELEGRKTTGAPGATLLPQVPLPNRRSQQEIQNFNAQQAVDQANTARNRIYSDPTSTQEQKLKADNDYLSAQNSLESTRKQQTDLGSGVLPSQYTLPGIASRAAGILTTGLLGFFGLENSILSDSGYYSQAINTLGGRLSQGQQQSGSTGGYEYQPKNLPVDPEKKSSDSESSSTETSSSDASSHEFQSGGGAEQWRPTFAGVLSALGMPAGWLSLGIAQMRTESGGNPKAINNWDSNAAKGTPSKGLMQVIDPTFQSYKSALYPSDIWDPGANIAAALRYTVARYGGPEGVWGQGHGYADGGWAFGPGTGTSDSIDARLSHGEFVVNAQAAAANADWLQAINSGLSMRAPALPQGLSARSSDAPSVNRDHSMNFGDTYVMNPQDFIDAVDRHQSKQAIGLSAALM